MVYFRLMFLLLFVPGIISASFSGGGDMILAEFGNLDIKDTVSIGDISQINICYGSIYGKFNLNKYTIYGKFNITPRNNMYVERLYGAVDIDNFEITIGKQYFNTGYGRIFKINNLMGSIYSPLNIYELSGKTGISFMYYSDNNYFNMRGGMFLRQAILLLSKFSYNTYAIEEEINIDRYGFKTGQFYNFRNGEAKYLFSFSLNADLFCGFNVEFQTFSNALEIDSFDYKGSISADYTIPIGNGVYIDAEYLYKKDKYSGTFSNTAVTSFYDRGNSILAFQASYPFNLTFKSSVFGLYNIDEGNYYIGGNLSIGKQIFYTDIILAYNKYTESMFLPYKGRLSGGLMFRLSL